MALGFYKTEDIDNIKDRLSNIESKILSINTDFIYKSEERYNDIVNIKEKSDVQSKKITELLTAIDNSYSNIANQLNTLNQSIDKSLNNETQISSLIKESQEKLNNIENIKENFISYENNIKKSIETAETYLRSSSQLPEALDKAKNEADEIEKTLKHSKATLNSILNNKKEIDAIFSSINGYEIPIEGSENEFEHIEGLKEKLEKSYQSIDLKIKSLEDIINKEIESTKEDYSELLSTAKNRYESLNLELNSLLPGALAKGLSDAFETKRASEQLSLNKLEKYFFLAIAGLIATALIPIGVDWYLLYHKEKDILDVIKETPNILLVTLPIYLPLLWFAHSTNKKSNLSKRLIEEYTHKSVLGKTFSGLSNQIDNLPNQNNIKEELRVKLLFNILQVSAENPGKLITDYNKSDHPIFDVIQKSSQLSDSIESLSKIPGFSLIGKKVSEIADKNLAEAKSKVENGINTNEMLEDDKK